MDSHGEKVRVMRDIGASFVFRAENGHCFHIPWGQSRFVASVFTGYSERGVNPVLTEYISNG